MREYLGHILHDTWVICGRIGQGSFGELFVGRDIFSGAPCAIKMQNEDVTAGLRWESEVLRMMQNCSRTPNFIHFGQLADGRELVVMELLGGEDMASLRGRLRISPASPAFTGGMSMQLAAHFAIEMLMCIQELHAHGLIHRDIKAANFVRKSAYSSSFCVVDFGITKQHADPVTGKVRSERPEAEFRGTTLYSSPSTHHNKDQSYVDDIWSMLFVFVDLLVGKLPWNAEVKTKDKVAVGGIKDRMVEHPNELMEWIFGDSSPCHSIRSNSGINSDTDDIEDLGNGYFLQVRLASTLKYGSQVDFAFLHTSFTAIIEECQQICQSIVLQRAGIIAPEPSVKAIEGHSDTNNRGEIVVTLTTPSESEVDEEYFGKCYEMNVSSIRYRELGGSLVWQGGLNTLQCFESCDVAVGEGTRNGTTAAIAGYKQDLAWPILSSSSTEKRDSLSVSYGSARSIQNLIRIRASFALDRYIKSKQQIPTTTEFSDFSTSISTTSVFEPIVSSYDLMRVWSVLSTALLELAEKDIELEIITPMNEILKAANYFFECGSNISGGTCTESEVQQKRDAFYACQKLIGKFRELKKICEERVPEITSFSHQKRRERDERPADGGGDQKSSLDGKRSRTT